MRHASKVIYFSHAKHLFYRTWSQYVIIGQQAPSNRHHWSIQSQRRRAWHRFCYWKSRTYLGFWWRPSYSTFWHLYSHDHERERDIHKVQDWLVFVLLRRQVRPAIFFSYHSPWWDSSRHVVLLYMLWFGQFSLDAILCKSEVTGAAKPHGNWNK